MVSDSLTSRRKFLIVLGHYGHMGGAERQALHLIEHLRRAHDAPVATLGWWGGEVLRKPLVEMGCETLVFPMPLVGSPAKMAIHLARLTRYLRSKVRPDVILPFGASHSKPLCRVWRHTGARYCWWNQQDEGRGLGGTRAERSALLNASDITSNSFAGQEFITEHYGLPKERILVYNNGTPIPSPDKIVPHWRKDLCLAEGQRLVSMVANVIPFKDHETLLRAWGTVVAIWRERQTTPPPLLALAGHLKNRAHVQHLKVLGFDLGLSGHVRFLDAIEDTNALLLESDLVVHSSLTEGCPNAVCEAMALSRPVVGTDIPGMRQALGPIPPPESLAKPRDTEDLAMKILAHLESPDLCHASGEANLRRIREEFSIDGMCHWFFEWIGAKLDARG